MANRKASRAWIERHVSDPYVKQARALGFRSRAAFKLLEIDAKDRIFARGQTVVDLGAAPGGWSQVAAEKVGPSGRVIAVDLLEIAPILGVTSVRGDVTESAMQRRLGDMIGATKIDLVLSDMAPNLSGMAVTDQAQSLRLSELALGFAVSHLKPGGVLVMKAFQGAGFPGLLAQVRASFDRVAVRKPGASRSRSSETYLVARGRH